MLTVKHDKGMVDQNFRGKTPKMTGHKSLQHQTDEVARQIPLIV